MPEWFRGLLKKPVDAPTSDERRPSRPAYSDDELGELQRRLARLEADYSALRIEWAELVDKVSRWFSRQAGRRSAELREAMQEAPEAPQPIALPSKADRKAQLRALARGRSA